MIEIGEVLKDFPLFNLDIVSFDLSIGTRLREKDCIKEIKGYDNRLLVHVSRAYRSSSIGIPGRPVSAPYVGDWDTGVCIKLLSKIHWKQFLQITEPTSLSARSVFRAISPLSGKLLSNGGVWR